MTVFEKLEKVQQILIAPKNQYNNFGKYSYRSCEDILEGLKPCLKEVGASVLVSDELVLIGERYYIKATAKFIDSADGKEICNTAYARESEDKKGMDASQVTGSTSSYARKYALNGLFCIDDVRDADSRDNRTQEQKAKTQKEIVDDASKKADNLKKINNVIDVLGKNGIVLDFVLKLYKVSDVKELSDKQCDNILKHLEDIKNKQEASKNE